MTDIERIATRTADALGGTLRRLARLARGLLVLTIVIAAATYATGWWVFDGGGWTVVGAVLCGLPVLAAALAWWRVARTATVAPKALDDLRGLLHDQRLRKSMGVLFDHDTQQPIGMAATNLGGIRRELQQRRTEVPALFATVRAVTTVPGLAALSVAGIVGLGLLGTILLIVGIVS